MSIKVSEVAKDLKYFFGSYSHKVRRGGKGGSSQSNRKMKLTLRGLYLDIERTVKSPKFAENPKKRHPKIT